ncbi:septum formation inhibitor Maf [Winogradskyella sp. 3972H.M.0a.05]|uniref:septum formation inhibitor Maf n=1 Tax=Winogradskyella sp. 3972H.M.0a.05 TaxID=2950277 RepID=UPI003395C2DD
MKRKPSHSLNILSFGLALCFLVSCKPKTSETKTIAEHTPKETNSSSVQKPAKPLSEDFKSYWYAGEAEITSFKLEQARYGELRQGNAVLVYVTEEFDKNLQVKADYSNPDNIPVLKLNATKNFYTGVYPYSIMQSTFFPVSNNQHAIKVTCSVQEWCGHVYSQLNNKEQFEIKSHSYFQSEADQDFTLSKAILENELWTQLRINPKSLPVGSIEIVPSFEFSRLRHASLKAYKANAELKNNSYSISYPELDRTLTINFNPEFPHEIVGWEESFKSGFGPNAKMMTTKATKLKTIKSAYWGKNSNADESMRKTLLLE